MHQRILYPLRAGAERRRPPWRLLIESRAPGVDIANFDAFQCAGFDVAVCDGPGERPSECPLVRGEPCSLVDDADVVLFEPCDLPWRTAVLGALRASRPELPVVVRTDEPAEDYGGCQTIHTTTSVNGQVSALHKAVMRWTSPQA
jgi:hypothetical protein